MGSEPPSQPLVLGMDGTRKCVVCADWEGDVVNAQEFFLKCFPVPMCGCWIWGGVLKDTGYGQVYANGRMHNAHRLAWQVFKGQIPDGLWVLHKCDTRACCNPDHLYLGDVRQNNRDMAIRGRTANHNKTHCPKGHELSGENLYIYKRPTYVARGCRECRNIVRLRYRR